MRVIGVASVLSLVSVCSGALARAQRAPVQQTALPTSSDLVACDAAKAEVQGHFDEALSLADKALSKDAKNPWAAYVRAGALGSLRRPDEAVVVFKEAEQRNSAAEMWGKSIAIWGQANVLSQVGPCEEAAPLFFERFAAFVAAVDKAAAELARQYAKHCTSRPIPR